MYQSIRPRPLVLSPSFRYGFALLSSLLLGALLVGSPPAVEAQTCTRSGNTVTGDLATDCTTLLGLKNTLRGTATLNWAAATDMDSWDGITVEGSPARVTKLELSWQGLTGTIPSALSSLTGLTVLDLSDNFLTGTIPDLSALTNLTTLNLYFNQALTWAPIPTWINSLTSLTTLDLRWTNREYDGTNSIPDLSALTSLTTLRLAGGSLGSSSPAFPDLSALTSLQELFIVATPLASGSIPSWITNLTNLTTLNLAATNRTGSIPDLSSLSSLANLNLSDNNFTAGAIPTWITTKTSLGTLNLSNTNRTGAIPDLSGLTGLSVLSLGTSTFRAAHQLEFGNNFDAGTFPSWITSLTSLRELNLSNTNRTGSIPALSALTELRRLNLDNNQLSGSIPAVSALTNLWELNLSHNQLSGSIPALSALTELQELNLSHNQLSGSIPALSALTKLITLDLGNNPTFTAEAVPDLSALTNLTYLDLYSTNRNGTFPTLSALTSLSVLDLSDNAFTAGTFPDLSALTSLETLYLWNTNRTGAFPNLSSLTSLNRLDLSDNNLTAGSIPSWIRSRTTWRTLSLWNTNRTGSIPSQFGNLSSLEWLDLSHNQLSGSIPSGGKLSSLDYVNLSNNQLSGRIPSARDLSSLRVLDYSNNKLTGSIPTSVSLPKIETLNYSRNQLSGSIPSVLGKSTTLQTLNLSHNKFTGAVPSSFGNSSSLVTLDLSHNDLSDAVPPGGNLPKLEVLDLSDNGLSGSIPTAKDLSSLRVLDYSNNRLTGSIPTGVSLPKIEYLDYRNNKLSGSIPSALSYATTLQTLNLSGNQLSGSIPTLSSLTNLEYLDLSGNQLSGNIPAVNALTKLKTLSLHNNPFTAGALPTVSALTALEYLNFSSTNRTGTFPTVSALTKLKTLDISNNPAFTAGAVTDLSALTALEHLDLSATNRNGTFPDLSSLTELKTLKISNNNAFDAGNFPDLSALTKLEIISLWSTNRTGAFPDLSALTNLWYLILSDNAFDAGTVPTWIESKTSLYVLGLQKTNRNGAFPDLSSLTNLVWLDLSNNAFDAGAIPTWFSSLTALEYLDLSATNRTGTIPSQLGSLRSLRHLYLANNSLTGSLPSGLNRSNLVLQIGGNSITGRGTEIVVAKTDDTLSSGFTYPGDNNSLCGSVASGTDLPDEPTLREAIIWANDTTEAKTITFAPSLKGQTITLADGADANSDADPLPELCSGKLTLNGDIDGDGTPDITLDGTDLPTAANGLVVPSSNNTVNGLTLTNIPNVGIIVIDLVTDLTANPPNPPVTNNTVTNNTVTGGKFGILVQAGYSIEISGTLYTGAGTVSNTTIRGNTVTATATVGIAAFTDYAGSTITKTTVEQNEIYANDGDGISVWSEGDNSTLADSITGLTIRDNHVYDHDAGIGIAVTGGFCGGSYNRVKATISGNTLARNGNATSSFPDISAGGGSNSSAAGCTANPQPTTTGNRLEVDILDNTSEDTPYTGISVFGGFRGTQSSVSVSNLTENGTTDFCALNSATKCAVGFTTSDSTGGYILKLITAKFQATEGSPGNLTATLHADSSGRPADTVLATLSGDKPTTAGDYTYKCPAPGCALSADTTYFVQFAAASGDQTNRYKWERVQNTAETKVPNDNGWSIADETDYEQNNSWQTATNVGRLTVSATTTPDSTQGTHANTVDATVERNAVWRSGTAGITVTGGTNSSDSNTVTATLNDNLVARVTALTSGDAGYGLYLRVAAAVPNDSTSSHNKLEIDGQGNFIHIKRNSSDSAAHDIFREKNNDSNRTNNAVKDDLGAVAFTPGCETKADKCQGGDTDFDTKDIVPLVNMRGNTEATPTSPPTSGLQLPEGVHDAKSPTGWKVVNIEMKDDEGDTVETLSTAAEVCIPISKGGSNPSIHRYNGETQKFEPLPSKISNGYVCANVTKFSYFTVQTSRSDGDGGGGGGGGRRAEPAVLHNRFERPVDGAVVSGIGLIAGWSFAEAAEVEIDTVALYVDRRQFAVIPCCAIRPDVAAHPPHAAFPPANTGHSGWGMIQNWGNLPAGPHTIEVVVTSSDGGEWRSPRHRITVLTPGDIAFADWGSLAEAAVQLDGEELVLDGVVLRDKETQEEHELTLRYAWQTLAQGFQLVASRPLTTARAQPPGLPALLARLGQWAADWLSPAGVTASTGIRAVYEVPADQAAVAGIGLIGGWAFPLDPADKIATVTVEIGETRRESAPCCATRPDVAENYPAAPQAGRSGWGLVFNYGHLTEGEHDLTAQIVTEAGLAYEKTHTVRVARLGGFAYVDRLELGKAEVDLVGEEIILSGVEVRDKESQAWQTIDVRLRWAAATQGLVIVDTETVP